MIYINDKIDGKLKNYRIKLYYSLMFAKVGLYVFGSKPQLHVSCD